MSTPLQIEAELRELADEIDVWDARLAWHEGKRNHFKDQLTKSEARAVMEYTGPATKARYYGVTMTEGERTDLAIAAGQLLVCERKMHSLEKKLLTVMGRNKSASNAYNLGY